MKLMKAYDRAHEAVKRLIILAHIGWYAWYTNKVINSYNLPETEILLAYLSPPIATWIVLNLYFLVKDSRNKDR